MDEIVCSVCLNPANYYSNYLNNIIISLANKYETYPFSPHLTIYGVVRASQKKIEEAVEYAFSDIQKLRLKTVKLNYSDKFTKTLFIQFAPNETLKRIHRLLSQKLRNYLINCKEYDLNPHLSLVYKRALSINEKEKAIKNIILKNGLIFDTCSIITASKPLETEDDINNLKEVYKKSF